MKIKVENSYSDGHESTIEYTVPDMDLPQRDSYTDSEVWIEDVWDHLYRYTGDGHGKDSSLGWFYGIDILEAADPELVGLHWENSGN